MRVCKHVHIPQMCMSVCECVVHVPCRVYLDLKWLLPASQSPPPSALFTAEPLCAWGRGWETCGGETGETGGRPSLPAACS